MKFCKLPLNYRRQAFEGKDRKDIDGHVDGQMDEILVKETNISYLIDTIRFQVTISEFHAGRGV